MPDAGRAKKHQSTEPLHEMLSVVASVFVVRDRKGDRAIRFEWSVDFGDWPSAVFMSPGNPVRLSGRLEVVVVAM